MRNVLFTRSTTPNQKKIKASSSPDKSKQKNEVNQNKLAFINKEIFSKPQEIAQYNLKKINTKDQIPESPPKSPPKTANLRSAIARKSPPRHKPLDEKFKDENSFFKFLLNNVNSDDHESIFESKREGEEDKGGWGESRKRKNGNSLGKKDEEGRRRDKVVIKREEKGERKKKEDEKRKDGGEEEGRRIEKKGTKEEGRWEKEERKGVEEILEEMREEKEMFYKKLNGIRRNKDLEEKLESIEKDKEEGFSKETAYNGSLPLALLVADLENSRNSKLKEILLLKESLKDLEKEGGREELEVRESKQCLLREMKEIERENEIIKAHIKKASANISDQEKTEKESLRLLKELQQTDKNDEEIIKLKYEIKELNEKIAEEEHRGRRMEERKREEDQKKEEEELERIELQKLTLELDRAKNLIKNLEAKKQELENQLKEEEEGGVNGSEEERLEVELGVIKGELEERVGQISLKQERKYEGGKEIYKLKEDVMRKEREIYLMKQANELMKKVKIKELENYSEDVRDLEAKLNDLEKCQRCTLNENKIVKLNEEISKLTQFKQEMELQAKLRISEIQLEISQVQNDLSSKDEQIKITEQNTKVLKAEAAHHLKEYEDQLDSLKQTSTSLSSALSSLQVTLFSLQSSLSSMQTSSSLPSPSLPSSPPLTSSSLAAPPSEIDSLTYELHEYQMILENLTNSRSALEEEITELSKKAVEEKGRMEEVRRKEEEGRKMIAKLERELEELRRVNSENEGLLNKMVGEKESLEKELAEIRDVNERMVRDSETNRSTIGEMGKKEEELGGKVKELDAAVQKKNK